LAQILIIDDDSDLLGVCTVGLAALGHDVRTAETGNEGLAEAAIRAPDVIVLDLGLPDLDGLEVCRRIRTWSSVPIIVLSADGSEDRKVDALDSPGESRRSANGLDWADTSRRWLCDCGSAVAWAAVFALTTEDEKMVLSSATRSLCGSPSNRTGSAIWGVV
jgi:CheY-like chemotaxis protein